MSKDEIIKICIKYDITNYNINDDESIDVHGGVYMFSKTLKKLPLRFRNVDGDFNCYNNLLTDLEGSPINVGGAFRCYHNRLSNFNGAPKNIYNMAVYQYNDIKDIYNIPKTTGYIYLEQNPVFILVYNFIRRVDRNDWIEFFNDCSTF